MSTTCLRLEPVARALVAGELSSADRAAADAHAEACASCGAIVRRERALRDLLESLPAAPAVVLSAPRLPAHPPRRRARLVLVAASAAAAAAVVLVALRLSAGVGATDVDGEDVAAPAGRPVIIRHVVDDPGYAPHPEDGLLALTAGVEAVVMRLPARRR